MSRNTIISNKAVVDIRKINDWYTEQGASPAARSFMNELNKRIALIKQLSYRYKSV